MQKLCITFLEKAYLWAFFNLIFLGICVLTDEAEWGKIGSRGKKVVSCGEFKIST